MRNPKFFSDGVATIIGDTRKDEPMAATRVEGLIAGLVLVASMACGGGEPSVVAEPDPLQPYVSVLGVAQDGGSPHIGCEKGCCRDLWDDPDSWRRVICLGLVDPSTGNRWLIDATPDLPKQLHSLLGLPGRSDGPSFKGVFLTHAHIGHYPGLMYFGREAMGAHGVPVYAMPRMASFLEGNGPWDQLVRLGNIDVVRIEDGKSVRLNDRLEVRPLLVPHRDEYSETVGYRITGPRRSVLFIPDVDKWEKMAIPIEDLIRDVDVAYLDGSFFDSDELTNRDMSEIPHPFIVESLERFEDLPLSERSKIRFIHLNHSNPALVADSEARRRIRDAGMAVAEEGEIISLD
jgi:pyrroloquinoline quinone biosynthesis protein B